MIITDGTGAGKAAAVDSSNHLHVQALVIDDAREANFHEDAYNINSSLVVLTNASESGILYLKNNEDRDLLIDGIVTILGPSANGATTDTCRIRIYKNPTAGTLISTATTSGVINSNRNYGSSKTLTADVFVGAQGETITDGTVHIESLVNPGSRVFFGIDEVLDKGASIAVSYEPPDSNTSMKCMAAIICHLKDNTFLD